MDNKDLLDDNLDWDAEIGNWANEADASASTPVTMIHTFNTEQEANLAAAMLQGEGINARVVSSITSGMTPFDYGNVRLFVATRQAADAAVILRKMTGERAVYNAPQTTSTYILMVIIIGIFVMGLLILLAQKVWRLL